MWEPIMGLTDQANSLYAESEAIIEAMSQAMIEAAATGQWGLVMDLADELAETETRIGNLHIGNGVYDG